MAVDYKDYYKILGLPKTATEKEIKAAYRSLARKNHPDVNPGDKARKKNSRTSARPTKCCPTPTSAPSTTSTATSGSPTARAAARPMPAAGGANGRRLRRRGRRRAAWTTSCLPCSAAQRRRAAASAASAPGRAARRQAQQDVEYPIEISLEDAYKGTTRLSP